MKYMLKKMMREKKMGPLKFKKREISPNTVLLEEESMPVTVENPTFDLTPAVVFDTDTIYTYDGPQAVSATPEQAIYEINSEILENVYSLRGIDESNVEAVTNVVLVSPCTRTTFGFSFSNTSLIPLRILMVISKSVCLSFMMLRS